MKTFYKIISVIFQPFLMCSFMMLWLINLPVFQFVTNEYRVFAALGTLFFTGILPVLFILLLKYAGKVSDMFISNSKERNFPYLFTCISYLCWNYLLMRLHLPLFIAIVGASSALIILLMWLVNLKWKISAHLCVMGGSFAFLVGISARLGIYPFGLIVAMVAATILLALSRVELKAHTPAQTVAGFFLGFLSTILPILLL